MIKYHIETGVYKCLNYIERFWDQRPKDSAIDEVFHSNNNKPVSLKFEILKLFWDNKINFINIALSTFFHQITKN